MTCGTRHATRWGDLLDDHFADEPGRTLPDLFARYGPAALELLAR